MTSLHEAVARGNIAEVKHLLDANKDIINSRDLSKRTALHIAVIEEKLEIISVLKEYNPDADIDDEYSHKALEYALLKEGSIGLKLIAALVSCGANINLKCKIDGYTYLQRAVEEKQFDKAKLLLSLGACPITTYSQKPLIAILAHRDYSLKWWNLILPYGGMIGCDVDQLFLSATALAIITKGQPVWGATFNDEPISNKTPEFVDALITADQLRPTLSKHAEFVKYDSLIKATQLCDDYESRQDLKAIVSLLQTERIYVKSLQYLALKSLYAHKKKEVGLPIPEALDDYAEKFKEADRIKPQDAKK